MSSSLIRKVRSLAPEFRNRKRRILSRRIGTGLESLEPRCLLATLAPFQVPLWHSGSSLAPTDSTFNFEMDDWNHDGKEDMFAIKKSGTGSGKTEVFVYSGATGFTAPPLSYATALSPTDDNWQFELADFDGGGTVDLIAVNRAGSSGKTEVTVLTGESSFLTSQKFNTVLGNVGSNWVFDVVDYNADGKLDLYGIEKSGGASGTTEVHVMTGAESSPGAKFRTYLLHTKTGLHPTGPEFDFHVADMDGNGSKDLVAIKKSGTASGRTEVHVLSGSGVPYQAFTSHIATELHVTDSNFEFDVIDFAAAGSAANPNPPLHDGLRDLVAFKKLSPGLTSTEVHAYTGEPRPLAGDATIPFPAGSTNTTPINFSTGIAISVEPGAPVSNSGPITGDAGSVASVNGAGTLQQSGNINVGQLGLEATLQLTSNASIHATNGVAVGSTGALILGPGTTVDLGSAVAAKNGGRVGGTGNILGNLSVGEPAAPGSLAILAPGSSAGRLTVGALTLNAGGKLVSEIKGNAAGTTYDQVVTQSVVLNNAHLETQATYAPAAGAEFVLIRNDGASAVTGSFVDSSGVALPEGAVIDNNFDGAGKTARVSYAGGDGNDVVVVVDGPFTFVSPTNSQADDISVRQSGGVIQFLVNGTVVRARTAAGLTQLTVTGEAGFVDQLSVDFGGGNPIPSGGLVFNAGIDPGDTVSLGSFTADEVNHTFNASGQNRVNIVNGTVTSTLVYPGQLMIYEGMTAASRTFTLTEQSDSVNLEGDTAGFAFTRLYYGQRYFEFPDPTNRLVIQGRGGLDAVNIAPLSQQFAASLTIDGGNGTDSIQVATSLTGLASLALTAESIGLSGTAYATVGSQTYTGNVTLQSNAAFSTSGTAGLTFAGTVNGAHDIEVNVPGTTTFVGAIGTTTPIGDATGGALRINSSGTTNFSNTVRLASGIVQADAAGPLKFDQNVTITGSAAGSSLQGQVILDGLAFKSVGPVTFGNTATDQLILSGGPVTIDTTNTGSLATVNAVVSGAQNIVKAGLGTLLLKTPATYTGSTTIQTGTLKLGAANLLPNGTAVSVATGANVNLAGFNETIAALTGSGATLLGVATLTVGGTVDAAYSGAISGTGNVRKRGSHRWTLAGSNTYTGWTKVEVGSLEVNGVIGAGAAAGQVSILANAELRGFGAINASSLISTGGTLYPTGVLEAPNTNLDSASTFKVDLGLSKLVVTGTVTLQSPHLAIGPTAGYVHVPGKDTAIIENDGTDAIVGQFADFAHGTPFDFGPEKFSRLLYRSANPLLVNDVYAHATLITGTPNQRVTSNAPGFIADIASDARGNYVVVWNDSEGSYLRLYSATGTPTSPIIPLDGWQGYPKLAMDGDGNFVLGYINPDTGVELLVQRFDRLGVRIGTPIEMSGISGNTSSWNIAMAGDGQFVVAADALTPTNEAGGGVRVRRYSATGIPLDSQPITVTPYAPGEFRGSPEIAINKRGDFIVAWQRIFENGQTWNLLARRFNNDGIPLDSQPALVADGAGYGKFNVGIDSQRNYSATFTRREGPDYDIPRIRKYSVSGQLVADIALGQGFSGTGDRYFGMDEQGNMAVVQSTGGGNGPSRLSVYHSSGQVIKNELVLGSELSHQGSTISMSRDGSIAVLTLQGSSLGYTSYRTQTFNETVDAVATRLTTDAKTSVVVTYDIDNGPVGPIGLNFYRSIDAVFDASDTLLAATTLSDSADLTRGAHSRSYAVGSGVGQIPLPITSADYYLFAVLDPGDFLFESDVDPITEDNVARYFVHFNRPPVLAGVPATRTYVENANRILIAPAGTVTDPDSSVPGYQDFGGGQLSVTITAGADANDRLTIVHQGTAAGQIGVSGSNVTFGGTVIGSFTGGLGSIPLAIAFNDKSSAASAQALLRAIAFTTLGDDPSTVPRNVRITLVDGDGGTSNMPTTSITVTAVNDRPVITGFGSAITYTEDSPPIAIAAATAVITDVDSANFAGGTLTAKMSVGARAEDRLSIRNTTTLTTNVSSQLLLSGTVIGTFTGGTGTTPLVITFNAQSSPAAASVVLQNIVYHADSENPSATPRTAWVQLTDGDNATSVAVTKTVNVTPVNDKPVLGGIGGTVPYPNNGAAVSLATAATVTDLDSPNLNLGKLTIRVTTGGNASNRIELSGTMFTTNASNQLLRSGVVIGTLNANAGMGLTKFEVTFNAQATPFYVQQLIRAMKFRTVGSTSTVDRVVSFTLTDGDNGTSATVSTLVDVQ